MRAGLRAWALSAGLGDELTDAIVLSVSEAAANSIEHGLGFDERGTVTVLARIRQDGVLETIVVDDGTWREPAAHSEAGRGFGLRIIDALMDDVGIEPRAAGTTVRMGLRPG